MPNPRPDPWPLLLAREARTAPELAAFMATAGPLVQRSPRGDGHAVIVLPGLGGGDSSTIPLRWFLDRLGYRTAGWGLGTNRGFSAAQHGLSAQPVFGGPAYFYRNIVYNVPMGGAVKNGGANPAGVLVYQNTFIAENSNVRGN